MNHAVTWYYVITTNSDRDYNLIMKGVMQMVRTMELFNENCDDDLFNV